MNAQEAIEQLLDLDWWEQPPDDNTLMSLIDWVQEKLTLESRSDAQAEIVVAAGTAALQLGSNERFDVEEDWHRAIQRLYQTGKLKWDIE